MAEAPSVTTFVMEDRLPWPEQNIAAGLGGPFDSGLLYDHGQARQCSIRSISALGATLCGEVLNAPGEEVALELATGQRPAGTIEWARGGEAGIRFKQPIDMFDIGLLEQVFLHLAFTGRIENLFFDLGVNRQLKADLLGNLLLSAFAAGLFEAGEQVLDRSMVLLEQRNCVQRL